MSGVRSAACLLPLVLLVGGGAAGDDDDSSPGTVYRFPPADRAEVEPNDSLATAEALGSLPGGYALTGSSARCGDEGTWEGADIDWFGFAPETGDPLTLTLDMWQGDVDLAVFDQDGALLVDGAEAGIEDETLSLALDPQAPWFLRIRCWRGNPGALWRLRVR